MQPADDAQHAALDDHFDARVSFIARVRARHRSDHAVAIERATRFFHFYAQSSKLAQPSRRGIVRDEMNQLAPPLPDRANQRALLLSQHELLPVTAQQADARQAIEQAGQ